MATTKHELSIASVILNFAIGVLLAVGGIWALQGGGDSAANAIREIFNGDIRNILVVVFGVIELLAGVYFIIRTFVPTGLASVGRIVSLIVVIVWIVAIVLSDILGSRGILNGGAKNFLNWIYTFASHLVILGAIIAVR